MNISLLEPIGITENKIEEYASILRAKGHNFTYYNTKTTDIDELKKRSENQDIVMIANNPYPSEVVRSTKTLKMIAVAFTGIDHVGIDACKEQGVMICNCAGYSNQSVAELVIGMAIGLYRKIGDGDERVRSGGTSTGLVGCEIAGKRVGIIGCGQIGYKTAKLFQAFGANVMAYSRNEKASWKEENITYASVDDILSNCDIISLHVPLNGGTRGFWSREKIQRMKKGSILINCARGPIVDNDALADALNEGRIAGAAIDVFDMEPPIPEDYKLCSAKNTLLTPHVAFATTEAMVRRAEIEFSNVEAYLNGVPENVCKL